MVFHCKQSALFLGLFTVFAVAAANPSMALSAKECSAKYKAAKSGGTLNGQTWNEFRKQECGSGAAAAEAKPAPETKPAPEAKTAPEAKPKVPSPSVATGNAVFPSAVDKKYANETAGKARFHTCLDQYHANKANGGNGSLKWIAKGGGYYSLCNKALKG